MMTTRRDRGTNTYAAVRITCYAPDAGEIAIAGTFNDWDTDGIAMTKTADGQWSADLRHPAGRYEYRFVVDGVWCSEPHLKHDRTDGGQDASIACGNSNRVLLIR